MGTRDWAGKLPNGEVTYDQEEYIDAWRALATPVERITGWRLAAFDPDLLFRVDANRSEQISVELAEHIQLLEEKYLRLQQKRPPVFVSLKASW